MQGWADDIKDEIRYLGDSTDNIDEIVMTGANVHLETLDDYTCMLILQNEKHRWHFNIVFSNNRSKGEIQVKRYE